LRRYAILKLQLVDSRKGVPLDTLHLFKTKTAISLKDVSDYGQSFCDALNLLQAFDILGAKVCAGRGKLHRSGTSENDFRA
jgi:hypothetical protein